MATWFFLLNGCMVLYIIFNSISVISKQPVHLSKLSWSSVLCTIFFPSHWLLFHVTTVKAMDSGERGMNPVTMTIINPWKEFWLSRGSNQPPPVLKYCRIPTELLGSTNGYMEKGFRKHDRKSRKCL